MLRHQLQLVKVGVRVFSPIIVLLTLTFGSSVVKADEQSCITLSNGNCGGSNADSKCYPQVEFLTPIMEGMWTDGSVRKASFCVSVGGSGYQPGSGAFKVIVMYQIDDGPEQPYGSCIRDEFLSKNSCVTCNSDCIYDTLIFPGGGGVVKFWAYAWQDQDIEDCQCTGDIITITVPGSGSVGDTTPVVIPTALELGIVECDEAIQDPINAVNGNVYFERTDVVLPTDRGLPLTFSRYYNSFGNYEGTMSYKWTHSFHYILFSSLDGGFTLLEPTGREVAFKKHFLENGGNSKIAFDAPYGVNYKLKVDTTNDRYTVTLDNDTRLFFQGTGPIDSMKDLAGNRIRIHYNGFQQVDTVENSSGRMLVLGYSLGRVASVKAAGGSILASYFYDEDVLLDSVYYADGTWEEYHYDQDSPNDQRITSITSSDGHLRQYAYDASGRATGFSLADSSQRETLSWSVVEATCPDSVKCQQNNQYGSGYITSFWAPDLSRRQVVSRLTSDCGECGTTYSYDGNGKKKRIVYANGTADSTVFDSRGNLIYEARGYNTPYAQLTWFRYDSSFNRVTRMQQFSVAKNGDSTGTQFVYDGSGNLTSMVDSGWSNASNRYIRTTSFSYNGAGQLTKINGPRTDVTTDTVRFEYHGNGDLQRQILFNTDTILFGERDLLGHRTWVRSPSGDTTRYTYNGRGWLTKVKYGAGFSDSQVVTFTYNVEGQLKSVNNFQGTGLTYLYNNKGYLEKMTNKLGEYIAYTHDSVGNPITEKIYNATPTLRWQQSYRYDVKHRLEAMFDANGDSTVYGYDAVGNLTSLRNPLGDITTYSYDSLSRLRQAIQPDTGTPITTSYTYDNNDNITKVTDPSGFEYTYNYDDLGNLVYANSLVTGATTYGYDSASNVTWEKNALGDSIAYKYDALNRLTAKLYPDSQNITYEYDGTEYSYGQGLLYKETTPAITTKYRYDRRGRLYQEIRTFSGNGKTFTTQYTLDRNGNLLTVNYPTNISVGYAYDSAANVSLVSYSHPDGASGSLASSITYAPFGRAETWTLGNGITVRNPYNTRYLLDSIHTGSDNIMKWAYTFDKLGNPTEIKDVITSANTRDFQYDKMSRLTEAVCADYADYQTRGYHYAYNGNIVGFRVVTGMLDFVQPFTYTNNRMTSFNNGVATRDFTYDAVGNITKEKAGTDSSLYAYNDAQRLTTLTYSGAAKTFAYDGQNRRVKSVISGTTTKFIPNASGQVYCEVNDAGTSIVTYAYWNGLLLAQLYAADNPACADTGGGIEDFGGGGGEEGLGEGGGGGGNCDSIVNIYYYHLDHLGTPWWMTNKNKAVSWKGEYLPYGEVYSETVSSSNDWRMPGQYDDRTGRPFYNWNRYYSPRIGRYYQPDPIGLNGGTNLYGYAGANPLRNSDKTGLDWYRTANGDLTWANYDNSFIGPRLSHYARELKLDYSNEMISPSIGFIPKFDYEYKIVRRQAVRDFTKNQMDACFLKEKALTTFDIKNRRDLLSGNFPYLFYEDRIFKAEDLGNRLFGEYGRVALFPLPILLAGAGYAQINAGTASLFWMNSWFDDPRDQHYIREGYNLYEPLYGGGGR